MKRALANAPRSGHSEEPFGSSPQRFTVDGSAALETFLAQLCSRVRGGVQTIIPAPKLEALVLGGGYGRGQGGVLQTNSGERPYNDLEFYVFLRGNRLLNDYNYRQGLSELGEHLSPEAGLHVEFKIEKLAEFQRRPISMFSYDLVARHLIVFGSKLLFQGCELHLDPRQIPPAEATRLLFNRCSGLLLAKEFLANPDLTHEQIDFVSRNLAKAQLALGDAMLTISGLYHWDCRERHRRLEELAPTATPPCFADIQRHHAAGVEFKLHPHIVRKTSEILKEEHAEVSDLASQTWLWVESHRLGHNFSNLRDYVLARLEKCAGTPLWRNYLLNLKTFGAKAVCDLNASRYPRERLFNSLPLLLWNARLAEEPAMIRYLQRQLHTEAADWSGLVSAYKRVWPSFG